MSERDYCAGANQAYGNVLALCLQNLGQRERKASSWRLERNAAVAALREICARFGDNDWSDDLRLADVIEKHLSNHLKEHR